MEILHTAGWTLLVLVGLYVFCNLVCARMFRHRFGWTRIGRPIERIVRRHRSEIDATSKPPQRAAAGR